MNTNQSNNQPQEKAESNNTMPHPDPLPPKDAEALKNHCRQKLAMIIRFLKEHEITNGQKTTYSLTKEEMELITTEQLRIKALWELAHNRPFPDLETWMNEPI